VGTRTALGTPPLKGMGDDVLGVNLTASQDMLTQKLMVGGRSPQREFSYKCSTLLPWYYPFVYTDMMYRILARRWTAGKANTTFSFLCLATIQRNDRETLSWTRTAGKHVALINSVLIAARAFSGRAVSVKPRDYVVG
jgi:hypothetical protein